MTCNDRPQYRKGQRVHVEFDGTVEATSLGTFYVRRDDGVLNTIDPATCTVTAADPEGWPPQPGDVWERDGVRWFARRTNLDRTWLIPESGTGSQVWPEEFKDAGTEPVLKSRRES